MLKVNNKKVIQDLAKTTYKANKKRNLLLTSQDFPTQRHHKLFDSVEFLLLLAF